MDNLEQFTLGTQDYGLLIKLIQLRVLQDIQTVEDALLKEQGSKNRLQMSDGPLHDLRMSFVGRHVSKLKTEYDDKKKWYETWLAMVSESGVSSTLLDCSLDEFLREYMATAERRCKLYLIMQEAVAVDIFDPFVGDGERALEERDTSDAVERVCVSCGFAADTGKKIRKQIHQAAKSAKGAKGSMAEFAPGQAMVALLAAGLPVSAVAGIVSGVMANTGAAAMAASFAMLNRDAVAVETQPVVGIQAVVGGGALLGGLSSEVLAQVLKEMPAEAAAVFTAKLVNYLTFLAQIAGEDGRVAMQFRTQATSLFLELKSRAEQEYLIAPDSVFAWTVIETFHGAYTKLAELPRLN